MRATVVGFMAIERGPLGAMDLFKWNGLDVQTFRTRKVVDEEFAAVDLAPRFDRDRIVAASFSTMEDRDVATLRMNELPRGDVEFRAQEERSLDREVDHLGEAVNGLAFGGEGTLTGIDLLL